MCVLHSVKCEVSGAVVVVLLMCAGFVKLLSQLTVIGDMSKEKFTGLLPKFMLYLNNFFTLL